MKKTLKAYMFLCTFFAQLALTMACFTSNSTCFFLSYQPDEPACLREMMNHKEMS